MKVLLRGHIRNSFDNDDLYNLCKTIQGQFGIELYIQTWDIFANTCSWRTVQLNAKKVTNETVFAYFRDLQHCIKLLIIDKEEDVQLNGTTLGCVSIGPMPIIGWKYMIFSMYHIICEVRKSVSPDENVLFTRFDILNNSNNKNVDQICNYITNFKNTELPLMFAGGVYDLHHGCENLMIGKIKVFYKLLENMWNCTDDVLLRHPSSYHQEFFFIFEYSHIQSTVGWG